MNKKNSMANNNISSESSTEKKPKGYRKRRTEGMQVSDFVVGLLYVLVSFGILVLVGIYYWNSHGASLAKFAFWEGENNKWIEVIFWAFFASIAQNTGYGAWKLSKRNFQKRDVLLQFARNVEAPFISLALIFVIFNLGISFGDTTISLKDVPISVAIAFTIITSFFAWETKNSLKVVAKWFTKQLQERLNINLDEDDENR